ncbi:MAG: hypothetical protein ABUL66_02250, partial [Verrucomicrobiota bacterium]
DRRRRFLAAHPEIVRRRQARRNLRREWKWRCRAVISADEADYLIHTVKALKIAVAPHFPAEARAMVCDDVLSQLAESDRNGRAGEVVRQVFAVANASFGGTAMTPVPLHRDLFSLAADIEMVLQKLEAKL